MYGKTQYTALTALAGVGLLSSICSAQLSHSNAFAMSIHDSMTQLESSTRGIVIDLETTEFNAQTVSFGVLLNQTDGGIASDLAGLENDFDSAQRGRLQSGIDAGRFVQPKEDNLNVVPLPSAAFAGFALLAGFAGVRFIRKSR